ncbi:MAG: HlyD family efflux transporter periplasmic adaptor subunit [Lachnospiraceae bacterium]|jgi:multidrug efflux pump subunit AcrA (membrane-fusion protein)|nr:HlyD family efflux transporter periplasmic adaptor subunit [Lachnospiraceae bacterium]
MNENTNPSKRREWVKNAAIVFLSIMLVLTFFSNTIMNYSLPEVATEYVQSGTITAKVRGTGNLEATDPYSVVVTESRKIESVNVKNGDVVEKDAVLFYLEDVESEELKTAQKELDDLRLAYLTGLFTGDITSDVISKVESGQTGSLASYQAKLADIDSRLKAAKNSLASATANQQNVQNNLNNLTGQKNIKDATVVDTTGEQQAVNSAAAAVANATEEVSRIEGEIAAVNSKIEEAVSLLGTPVTGEDGSVSLTGGLENFQNAKDTAETELAEKQIALSEAQQKLQEAEQKVQEATAAGIQEDIEKAQLEYNEIKVYIYDPAAGDVQVATDKLNVANGELEKAAQALSSYNSNKDLLASLEASLENANRNLNNAKATQTSAQEALSNKEAKAKDISAQNDLNTQIAQATNSKTQAETQVANITEEITKLETEKSDLVKALTAELNLSAQNAQIAQKEEEIERLKEKSVGSTITAPVAGTVASINLVAGESTKPEEVLAVIQPAGKGFTMSFSATTEQAKKLSVGDVAELQNAWYYDNVKATLASIKPDPDDPAQKKLLTFNVEGDVQAGQALSVSVGQRSSEYELVVPNSAIREDNNGKFILIVESKSSPLGNRYIATRVDVEVLASDDTHTAISAGLYGYEYVITTATKPVEAGKQVRLTD